MNKKLKQIAASLLSVLMIVCFMPSMAFAAEDAADVVAKVTTDDTTEAIPYASFDEALEATNRDANEDKNAVIALEKDATVATEANVTIPMVIDLNGHKLEGADKLSPAEGADVEDGDICRSEVKDGKITFAEHDATIIYNWQQDSKTGAWAVVSESWTCDNCGTKTVDTAADMTGKMADPDTSVEGKITYNYVDKEDEDDVLDSKTEDAEIASKYSLTKDPYIVTVNGKIQRKDGKPVVKAGMVDVNNNEVEADITLSEATTAELKGATVYEADGVTVTTERTTKPTCTEGGKVVYKVVVKDPNGKVVKETFLLDEEASEEVAHEKGQFAGIKLLTKSVSYDTAAAASEVPDVVKTTSEEVTEEGSIVTKYYAWTYGDLIPAETTTINAQPAVEADGSFTYMPVYYCDFEVGNDSRNQVNGDAVTVKPYANATKSSENNATHSSCTEWKYPAIAITYTFTKTKGDVVKSTLTYNGTVSPVAKPESAVSHVSDNTKYDVAEEDQPTCMKEGKATVKCAICGEDNVTVPIAKTADTFGAFNGTVDQAVADLARQQSVPVGIVTVNSSKTEGTITATCVDNGGVFKYCTAGHWVEQSKVEKKGHNFTSVITTGNWDEGETPSANYDKTKDYIFKAEQNCKNDGCAVSTTVKYHSDKKGTDGANDKYGAVTVVDEEKGADCKTKAKVTYTVEGLTYTTGKPVSVEFEKGDDTKGDHKYVGKSWNWSKDYSKATANVECSVCKHTDVEAGKVSKKVEESGMTVYTATYGDIKDTKSAYTFDNAEVKVSFDKTKITDANLVTGVAGASPATPDVEVTIDGVKVDPKSYDVEWNAADVTGKPGVKAVTAKVSWSEDITKGDVYKAQSDDLKKTTSVTSAAYNVAAKDTFTRINASLQKNGEDFNVDPRTGFVRYDGSSYTVATDAYDADGLVKDATITYAVSNKLISEKDADVQQQKIEDLAYNKDSLEFKEIGEYYVYAKVTKDGYTTYTGYATTLKIKKGLLKVYLDNATSTEGTIPTLQFRVVAYDDVDEAYVDVKDFDKSLITFTSVGGQALDKLTPGTYKLAASADNYSVECVDSGSDQVAKLTVVAKDSSGSAEQDAAEKANAEAAADKAAKAAEGITTAAGYSEADVDAVKKAADALAATKAKAGATAAEIQAATKALNDAITTAKINKAKKLTVKGLKVKAGKKKAVVKFKKTKGAKSYQIQYRIKGKKWTKKVSKKNKFTAKKLKGGKKYQFKVRTISKVGKKTVYGKWTKVKTVKIKK